MLNQITLGRRKNAGDPTIVDDANIGYETDDGLQELSNVEHDFDEVTGAGKHKSISFLNATDVVALKDGTVSAPSLTHEGSLNTGAYFPASDVLALVAAGIEALRIGPNQNVHIGSAGGAGYGNYAKLAAVETSNAAQINLRGENEHASATGTMLWAGCARAATTAYSFLRAYSASTGTPDQEFELRGDGNAYADGAWNGGGADVATLIESTDGSAIPRGTSVVLEGGKVRAATEVDDPEDIIGIVRGSTDGVSLLMNTAWNRWQGKYLRDDFGDYILQDREVLVWQDEKGKEYAVYADDPMAGQAPENAVSLLQAERTLNPEYDPDKEYVTRIEREEWNIIGTLDLMPLRRGQPTNPRWRKVKDLSETVEEWYIR